MAKGDGNKLKSLIQGVPSGLLVDTAWLERRGYYCSLRNHYVSNGWLEQPARGVYRMPGGTLLWQQAAISLQSMMRFAGVVGGSTAMHLHGYTHYIPFGDLPEAHLYGVGRPPGWLFNLPGDTRFIFHKTRRLFPDIPTVPEPLDLNAWKDGNAKAQDMASGVDAEFMAASFTRKPWGVRDWPLVLSTPERAMLEIIEELPDRGSFDLVDKFIEGVVTIDTGHMNTLLRRCGSIKVKRLFLWFAKRHNFNWVESIDLDAIDLGSGKRQIFKNGRLDTRFNITVPADADDLYHY